MKVKIEDLEIKAEKDFSKRLETSNYKEFMLRLDAIEKKINQQSEWLSDITMKMYVDEN